MRCPHCGGLNADKASFCSYCGRDLVTSSRSPSRQQPQPTQRTQQPVYPPPPPGQGSPRPFAPSQNPQASPTTSKPPTPWQPVPPASAQKNVLPTQARRTDTSTSSAPEPPAPFPPRTLQQLLALEPGALSYTIVQDTIGDGRKKIVRIAYPRCTAWQQAATLLKALKEVKADKFDSVIIQGVSERDANVYQFTQGQLCFDRNVRLGSQTLNRYLIETGNGYEADAVRIVLAE
jgi:coenzyme F420-reducing hydrogenase delta subunit